MKTFLALVLSIISLSHVYAQQEAYYTQYMFNNMQNNPGFTGARRVTSLVAAYRNQWVGFKGNPRSYYASYDAPFVGIEKLGIGGMVSSQSEGIMSRFAVTPSVSYAVVHTDESTLRLGFNATWRQYRFDLQSSGANVIEKQDPILSESEVVSFSNMNVGFGAYYDKKNIYAGLSIPNLRKNALVLNDKATGKTKTGTERRHIYALVGGIFALKGNTNIQLKPSLLIRYTAGVPLNIDANFNALFKDKIMTGLAYRFGTTGTSHSVSLVTMVQVANTLSIGMSYDYGFSHGGDLIGNNSVEAAVRYDIRVTSKDMHNPRFFF